MKDLIKDTKKQLPEMPEFKFAIRSPLPNTFLPTRAEPLATGWDVKAAWNNDDLDKPIDKYKYMESKYSLLNVDEKEFTLFESKSSNVIYKVKEIITKKATKAKPTTITLEIISGFIPSGEFVKIPLGFKILAPEGWWIELKPRSSTFAKKQCHSLYGTIDNGFYNELVFALQYLPPNNLYYHNHNMRLNSSNGCCGDQETSYYLNEDEIHQDYLEVSMGEAIAQIIPVKLQHMDVSEISNEDFDLLVKKQQNKVKSQFGNVRDGGIGSTDKK